MIYNSKSEIEYCIKPRKRRNRQGFMENFPLASIFDIMQMYRTRTTQGSTFRSIGNLPRPFEEVVVQTVNGVDLPMFLRAVIRSSDRARDRPAIPTSVYNRMRLFDTRPGDDAGHLLAYSLGGGMDNDFNFVPQAARLNRHSLGETSIWLGEETAMATFLDNNANANIEWNLVVHYEDPLRNNFRPIAFCLQYTRYNPNYPPSPEMCFSNDPTHDCLYDEQ